MTELEHIANFSFEKHCTLEVVYFMMMISVLN